jgi:hypothetical protein
MAIGRLYFIRNPSRTLCNKYHRHKNWWHNRIVKMDAQVIAKNHNDPNIQQQEVLTATEKLPWPNTKEFERDFKDNDAVSSLMARPLPLYCRTTQPADTPPPAPLGWCHHIHSTWTQNFTHITLSIFYILTYILNFYLKLNTVKFYIKLFWSSV